MVKPPNSTNCYIFDAQEQHIEIVFINISPQCIKYEYSEYEIVAISTGSYTLDSLGFFPHQKRRTILHLECAAYNETIFGIEDVKTSLMMNVIVDTTR
jgi:hypothetical protein